MSEETIMSIDDATPRDWDNAWTNGFKGRAVPEKLTAENTPTGWLTDPQIQTTLADIPLLPEDAAKRKAIPIHTGFISYFPRAICAVAEQSLVGGLQHGQTVDTLHWDRAKSGDELDALTRHIIEEDWVAVAWRAMANLEKHLEREALEASQRG